jgi:hypothetical protein
MSQSVTSDAGLGSRLADIVGVVGDRQTYRNLLYLALAFPLGMIYYMVVFFGFAFGLALSVFVVGLGILLATAIGVRYLASFERRLANRLLGTSIADPTDVDGSDGGIVATAKAYLTASSTWRGLGFVVLKFPIGVLSFVLLVTFLGTGVELLLNPVFPAGVFSVEIGGWEVAQSVESTTERALAVPAGAVLALLGLHITNAFADVNASIASSLLGPNGSDGADGSE